MSFTKVGGQSKHKIQTQSNKKYHIEKFNFRVSHFNAKQNN